MARTRTTFTDRPRNVGIDRKGSAVYFTYIFPDGRRRSLGTDRSAAYSAADALNAHFANPSLDLATLLAPKVRPSPSNPVIPELIESFRAHLQSKRYSSSFRHEIEYKLRAYAKAWPTLTVQQLSTKSIAEHLDQYGPSSYIKHRKLLIDLCQFAAHRGYIRDNPAALTLSKTEPPKTRTRHTLEAVMKIHAKSEPWLQRAILLGLHSLQRGDDLVSMLRSQVNPDSLTMTVLQKKTRNYRNPVHLEIEMSEGLSSVVRDCLEDPTPGPHLLRTRPKRMTRQAREAKAHHFAITRDHLTRGFTEARDQSGVYDHLPKPARPTFHELRALGMHLLTEAGYSKEYVMALSGHATDAMFQRYTKDHETKKPRRVSAGLTTSFAENSPKIHRNGQPST